MASPELLLARLEAIGASLERTEGALALIGLGSVGRELDRLDAFSDLDFFVIVERGRKQHFLADLRWLTDLAPVAFQFMNTEDGYKLLFEDGVFCEFAVFEPEELARIPFAAGRLVWRREGVDESLAEPSAQAGQRSERPAEFLLGEALTNLYVGLGRFRRGEKLSAARFIQGYAVDRVLELVAQTEAPAPGHADPFVGERRCEQRFPMLEQLLPDFVQGYERSPESALAILAFLEQRFEISPQLSATIRQLTEGPRC